MKSIILTLLLLLNFSFIFCETVVIHKTDGVYLQFEVVEIIDITFDDVVNEAMQIHKIDATTDEIAIALIDNIEFTETPTGTMLINKTDGTTYEIEIAQIINISFNEITSIEETTELINTIPIRFLENFPNPFNPNTMICFELNEPGFTKIEIYNIRGEKINTILKTVLQTGLHNFEWKGTDEAGYNSSSGVYFYKISVNGQHKTNKMLLLK